MASFKCFACGKKVKSIFMNWPGFEVITRDGQRVCVGYECYKKIKTAGAAGYLSPNGSRLKMIGKEAAE